MSNKTIVFGQGKVGVRNINAAEPAVELSQLKSAHKIGKVTGNSGDRLALLVFQNETSLNVLISALQRCRENFVQLPDELRLGA